MKKTFTRFLAALALLVFFIPSMIAVGQTRAEVVAYTLDGTIAGSGSNYATENSITQDNISWKVTGNTTTNPWRIGGKSISNVDRPVYSTNPIADNITKIEVTHGTASNITVNSWTVIVASDASFTNVVSTLTPTFTASATTTINRPSGADWTNCYYKFIYNVTVTQSSNRFVQFVKAEFYKQEGSGPVIATPTFSLAAGTYIGTQSVTISCETENSTIYYTTDDSTPDNTSTAYTGAITVSGTTTIKAIAYVGTDASSVASATYNIINLEHTGTATDPYSVADARAAIDANVGISGVYATGIVSAIPTAWSTQYNNITFNFVDEEGDSNFLQAYRCVNGDNVNASEVAVGDSVVVYGNLTKYNSTYEFGQGCQLVSLTHPAVAVEAPTFSPVAGTYAEEQTVTLNCATETASIFYTIDGTDPATSNSSTQYVNPITVSSTMTIKAVAVMGQYTSTVASATYHICSAENPYTVTEALSFSEYPANGIYVSGIVSTAPTSLSSGTLTYYISVDGEATNQLEVYKGKDLNNEAFTAVDDIQVGDIVTIYGNVQVYNSTIEFASGNYLVSFERPVVIDPSITIAAAELTVNADAHNSTIAVTYQDIATDAVAPTINFYESDGLTTTTYSWFTTAFDSNYDITYSVPANEGAARTAYFKISATDDDGNPYTSELFAFTQSEYQVDYAELPFEWEGGERSAFEALNGTYTYSVGDYGENQGLYRMKLDGDDDYIQVKTDSQPGKVTIGVKMIGGATASTITVQGSADGETFNNVEALTISGTQNSIHTLETTNAFASADRYVRLLFTKGSNVGVGPITIAKPSLEPSITVANATVDLTAEEADGELALTYANITISSFEDFNIQYYNENEEEISEPDWIFATVAEEQDGSYVVSYMVEENDGDARSAFFKVYAAGNAKDNVYSNMITINQAAPVVPPTPGNWVVCSLADLTENDIFVIVGDNGDTYAMSNDKGTQSAPSAVAVTVVDGTLSDEPDDNLKWNISITDEGYIFYPNGTTETWLYCNNTNNGVRVGNITTNVFTMSDNGYLQNTSNNRYVGIYSSQDWRCYTNTTGNIAGQTFAFYKNAEPTPTETYTLDIAGYTNDNATNGWYLIASPVMDDITPAAGNGFITSAYDLYRFNPTANKEWENWKTEGDHYQFPIEHGRGYLYASKTTTTLQFTGTPHTDSEVTLAYTGWNLIGNPSNIEVTISESFYVMNDDHNDLVAAASGRTVHGLEGIFVYGNAEDVIGFEEQPAKRANSQVTLNIVGSNGNVIDRAIVNFDSNNTMTKLMLDESNTKIYIPMSDANYAVVSSNGKGNMPVNFKAARTGKYTLRVETEGVDMNYMHIIDRLTGEDINVLLDNEYTFIAAQNDVEGRFILSFNENGYNAEADETFAFQNGSDVIVNGNGELQVFDVTGRMVMNTMINGVQSVNIPQGVYIFRLNEKIQKIVVR